MTIKAIIFDYGGVLSTTGKLLPLAEKYAVEFKKDKGKFTTIIETSWNKARINEISSKDFWGSLANFIGIESNELRRRVVDEFSVLRPEMISLIKKLKKSYKLAIISNQIEDWLEEIIEKNEFNKLFDVIVTSYNVKVAKPDLAIFELAINRLGVAAKECVYVDDLEKNIPPAEKLGMKTILFKDNFQLIKDLKKLGVEIKT